MENNICHDCGKQIQIGQDQEIVNGQLLKYVLPDGKDKFIFKCSDCYAKDKSLRNYQEAEVYSRVVGYIRPVAQFNEGKQQEYKDRKEYKISKGMEA
jgi:hypothetical protein